MPLKDSRRSPQPAAQHHSPLLLDGLCLLTTHKIAALLLLEYAFELILSDGVYSIPVRRFTFRPLFQLVPSAHILATFRTSPFPCKKFSKTRHTFQLLLNSERFYLQWSCSSNYRANFGTVHAGEDDVYALKAVRWTVTQP